MRTVGIDARKYFDYGIGTYLQGLLREFAQGSEQYDFTLYVSPEDTLDGTVAAEYRREIVPWKKYSAGELLFLGRKAARSNVDILHIPHYTLPFGFPGPSVITIHDLIHLRFPEYYSWPKRFYAKTVMSRALRSASAVIADSEYVRNDILSLFPVSPDKIHTIPLAVGNHFSRLSESSIDEFRARNAIRNPYVLYVGGIGRHKDIATLLECFDLVAERMNDCELLFAGVPGSKMKELTARARHPNRIRFLGRLSRTDLNAAYNGATVLVMTSRYEGFGLPPLEAMACGTPCVVSDAGSLPEVVGNAAIICSTGHAAEFAEAVVTIMTRPGERADLVKRGLSNVMRFSWHTTALKTMEVYDSVR